MSRKGISVFMKPCLHLVPSRLKKVSATFSSDGLLLVACLIGSTGLFSAPAHAGHWEVLGDVRLAPECPSSTSDYDYRYHCVNRSAITVPWSGAAFDPKHSRMIVWGGGHGDYWGNEVYVIDFAKRTAKRLTDPSPYALRGKGCSEQLGDGRPRGRHTYGGLAYIPEGNRLLAYGGSLACGAGDMSRGTWTFELESNSWQRLRGAGGAPGNVNVLTAYSPGDERVYLADVRGLYAFSLKHGRWRRLSNEPLIAARYGGMTLDTKRHWLWLLGNGKVQVIDLDKPPYHARTVPTAGGDLVLHGGFPGVLYDPKRDRIVAYSNGRHFKGDTRSVFFLNPDTGRWRVETDRGIEAPKNQSVGVFGRWAYAPELDAYVMYNLTTEPAYLYHPDGPADSAH